MRRNNVSSEDSANRFAVGLADVFQEVVPRGRSDACLAHTNGSDCEQPQSVWSYRFEASRTATPVNLSGGGAIFPNAIGGNGGSRTGFSCDQTHNCNSHDGPGRVSGNESGHCKSSPVLKLLRR
jgi:hypothetical protein